VTIDARLLWTGEKDRDAHLKSADFLDAEREPWNRFIGQGVELIGSNDALFSGSLTIRGVTTGGLPCRPRHRLRDRHKWGTSAHNWAYRLASMGRAGYGVGPLFSATSPDHRAGLGCDHERYMQSVWVVVSGGGGVTLGTDVQNLWPKMPEYEPSCQ